MTTLYVGEIEGHAFVAAHTLSGEEQQHAAELIGKLAPPDDHDPIEFASGWAIHNAAPDICPEVVDGVIDTEDVATEFVGKVPKDDVARFVGKEALRQILSFGRSRNLSKMPSPVAEHPVSILSIAI